MKTPSIGVVLLMVAFAAGTVLAQAQAGPPTTPDQKLKQKIPTVNVVKLPLAQVLEQYSKLSGLPIQADWNGLEAAGITKERLVTIKAYQLPFEKVLDLTVDSIAHKNRPLAWYLSEGTVHVTSQARALLRSQVAMPILAAGTGGVAKPFRGVRQITFNQTPLRAAIEFFRDVTGVNFHVNWRALESSNITGDTPVTLNARGISIARALDLVLDQLNVGHDRFSSVYWIIEGGIVQISTGETFNRTTKVKTYDVADLLMVVPNFTGPRINLASGNTGNNTSNTGGGLFGGDNDDNNDDDTDDDEESTREQREELKKTLIEVIMLSIGEDMWAPQGKGSIKFLRDRLVISQTLLGFKLLGEAVSR